MKPIRCLSAAALLLLTSGPDEGQWLPQQVLAMDWAELQKRGLELSKDEFWHPDRGGVLSAAVQIGGCSASFVSSDGLLVTNHHCGFRAVQRLSSVETNYLDAGFVAPSKTAELPAPGMVVYVVRRIRDVTAEVHAAQAKAETDLDRWQATQRAIEELVREGEQEPNTVCHVASFLEGQQYHLYYRTRIEDVRLAFAPPRSIGEFGGEVDNWEWPRHTGDFCFFRAYVGPDGTPRTYREDNVPYRPAHFLKTSASGVQEGDLVMILGYPGRTERYLTSSAVSDRQSVTYPFRHRLFSDIIDVLHRAGARDEARRLRYASLVKSLANTQKNALGMIEGLRRNGTVAHKLAEEAAFRSWIEESAGGAEFAGVLEEMLDLDEQARRTLMRDQVSRLLGSAGLAPLVATLAEAARAVESAASDDEPIPRGLERRLASPSLTTDFDTVQRPILALLLEEARSLPEAQRLRGTEALIAAEAGTAEWLSEALAASQMLDAERRALLFAQGRHAVAASKDPLVVLARGIAQEAIARAGRDDGRRGRLLEVGRRWIEGQQKWRGTSFYPDANSTLRVSIAAVKGYEPRDGVIHVPHTTVAGVLDKEKGAAPFASPAALLGAAEGRTRSKFFDQGVGDVPVCFLSDGDTTGGNSGSPVVNGRGELVGLNFDRVFEAVAGDYGWRPERSRNISVDVRYILWVLEQVLPAPHLLAELGV
ncbi:MAG: S46 family peptidase [Planctomycetota bacterium]